MSELRVILTTEMQGEGSSHDASAEDRPPRLRQPSADPSSRRSRGADGRSGHSHGGAAQGRGRGVEDGTQAQSIQARLAGEADSSHAPGNMEERRVSFTPLFEAQHEARY